MRLGRGGGVARLHPGGAAPRGPALSRIPAAAARRLALAAALALAAPARAGDSDGAAPIPAEQARLAASSLLVDGAAAGGRAVVVGARGHILFSGDGGGTWTQAQVPVRALLTAVHMHDETIGWAVGHDAVVLRTGDGGETWELVHRDAEAAVPLLDVWFRDSRSGIAVGGFGLVLATADGGGAWTCRNGCPDGDPEGPPLLRRAGNDFADDYHLNAIAPAGPDRLYLAGEAGALYRSDDGGESWRALDSPYGGSWFAALALDRDTVLAAGLRGRLYRSADGGANWTRIDTGTEAALTALARAGDGRIIAAGLAGTALEVRGAARSAAALPAPSRRGAAGAFAAPGGRVLLVGEFGVAPLAAGE